MQTYSKADFEQIAIAIETDVREVLKQLHFFEGAANWYALERGLPRDTPRARKSPTPPSETSNLP